MAARATLELIGPAGNVRLYASDSGDGGAASRTSSEIGQAEKDSTEDMATPLMATDVGGGDDTPGGLSHDHRQARAMHFRATSRRKRLITECSASREYMYYLPWELPLDQPHTPKAD